MFLTASVCKYTYCQPDGIQTQKDRTGVNKIKGNYLISRIYLYYFITGISSNITYIGNNIMSYG